MISRPMYIVSMSLLFFFLVPGDGGTQFEAKLNKTTAPHSLCTLKTNDYFSLWLNLEELAPIVIDCFTDNMK